MAYEIMTLFAVAAKSSVAAMKSGEEKIVKAKAKKTYRRSSVNKSKEKHGES